MIATAALVALWPLLVGLGILVKVTSPGPALYRAQRAGIGGKPFEILKFRSMRSGSSGAKVTAAGDPRITAVGRFLRRSKLDELPQLVNVARGEMSFVGPRPEDPSLIDLSDPMTAELYQYPPGITGPASLAFRNEEQILAASLGDPMESYGKLAAQKMELDLEYLRRRTLKSDMSVVLRTISGKSPAPGGEGELADSNTKQLSSTYREYEGTYATKWAASNPGNREIIAERQKLAEALLGTDRTEARRVLDLGGGSAGTFPEFFNQASVVCLDLLLWRVSAGLDGPNSQSLICADGRQTPFLDGSFDVIVIGTVLSSVTKELAAALLAEADRVLAPGGAILIYDMRLPSPGNRSIRPVSLRAIKQALPGFVFQSQSLTVLPPLARRLGDSTAILYPKLGRLPILRSHLLVVGRRCES